jgi:hypothetical protein
MKPFVSEPRAARLVVLALALFAASCGSGGPKAYPVKGVLKVNGKPAEGATVSFHRKEPFEKTIVPTGKTDKDGKFSLTTYKVDDGAPVGEYYVSITWPASRKGWRPGPDRLDGKFSDPKRSPITRTVEAKDLNEVETIDIKAELKEVEETPVHEKKKDEKH